MDLGSGFGVGCWGRDLGCGLWVGILGRDFGVGISKSEGEGINVLCSHK